MTLRIAVVDAVLNEAVDQVHDQATQAGISLVAAGQDLDLRGAMHERFGRVVHDGYGLTEASPVVTTTAVASEPRPGSIGPPLPGSHARS